jgi:hypothetical protein
MPVALQEAPMRRVLSSLIVAVATAVALPAAAQEVPEGGPQANGESKPDVPMEAKGGTKTVTVELVSNDEHATIERRLGTFQLSGLPFVDASFSAVGHWEEACIAPCDVKLDPHYSYRVAGDGLTPSRSFGLPRDRDRVRLSAEMGSSSGRLGGFVLTGIGVGSALLGGAALIASPILESQDAGSKGFRSVVLAGGVIFLAAGVVEMGLGLYLWATNGSTVRADHGVVSAAARPRITPSGIAF